MSEEQAAYSAVDRTPMKAYTRTRVPLMNISGKLFLGYEDAVLWARNAYGESLAIRTEYLDGAVQAWRAEVFVDGALAATAHKNLKGSLSDADGAGEDDAFTKAESGAVRRALINLGFSTDQAIALNKSNGFTDDGKAMRGKAEGKKTPKPAPPRQQQPTQAPAQAAQSADPAPF